MFFIVEERQAIDARTQRPQRFITADLSEALRIPELYELKQSDLLACILGFNGRHRLEQVAEAYVGSATQQFAVKLGSGEVIFISSSDTGQTLSCGVSVMFPEMPEKQAKKF